MANFKTCANNHNYDADIYPECPYCPTTTGHIDYEKTLMSFKNTQLVDEGNDQQFKRTLIDEGTVQFNPTEAFTNKETVHPFKRTSIAGEEPSVSANTNQGIQKRKLVGWLVTFSNDEGGQDYKLYVGKNRIGSAETSDIVIRDSSVSGDHVMILFRENEFLFRDNFSTNGTKVNGVSADEGRLKEGDEIKIGNTTFKFKTVF